VSSAAGEEECESSAPSSLGVVGMDRATTESSDGILDEARLVERVGVDVDLNVVLVADLEGRVDGGGSRSPVLRITLRQITPLSSAKAPKPTS